MNYYPTERRVCIKCGKTFFGPIRGGASDEYCLRPCKPKTACYMQDRDEQIERNKCNGKLKHSVQQFTPHLVKTNYVKNFTWVGVPIIQYPTDMFTIAELLWRIKPDLVLETGMAFGGSLLFYASVLEAIGDGEVIGIEIDPRDDNMQRLKSYDLFKNRISIIKASSTEWGHVKPWLYQYTSGCRTIFVILDSHHTHEHVLKELELYAPLVSKDSYLVVMDTAIQFYGHLDKNQDRPWGVDNNPWTAVQEFMRGNDEFIIDKEVEQQALITSAPDGWLRRAR